MAAEHGHLDILRRLVSCGAELNAREGLQGLTALHYALQNRDEPMLQFLLSCRGLNPERRSYRGQSAWQMVPRVSERLTLVLRQRGVQSPGCSSDEEESSDDDEVSYGFRIICCQLAQETQKLWIRPTIQSHSLFTCNFHFPKSAFLAPLATVTAKPRAILKNTPKIA